MIVASAVLWLLAGAQEVKPVDEALSKPVTYSTVAARLENVLPELAEKAGVKMEAVGDTKDEVLLIRVKDMPLKDLMAKIAEVGAGQWDFKDGVHRFTRPAELWRKIEADDRARTIQLLQADAEETEKQVGKTKSWTSEDAERFVAQYCEASKKMRTAGEPSDELVTHINALSRSCPVAQFGHRVFLAFDPEVLASIPYGRRVVFASNPTRMQRPLPQGATSFLKTYMAQRAVLARAVATQNAGPEDIGSWFPKNPNAAASKMLVVVERDHAVLVEAKLLDADGAVLAEGPHAVAVERCSPTPNTSTVPPTPVRYSENTERLFEPIRAALKVTPFPPAASDPLPADLLDRLCDPERFDPLSTQPTDEILSLVDAMKAQNVVAVVPDLMLSLRSAAAGGKKVGEVWEELVRRHDMNLDLASGCLTVSYRCPSSRLRRRVPREAIRALFTAYRRQKVVRLDDVAGYLCSCREVDALEFNVFPNQYPDESFVREIVGAGGMPLLDPVSRTGYVLYALLGPDQKRALAEGRSLTFGSLTPTQRKLLADGLFDGDERIYGSAESTVGPSLPDALRNEPTELLPAGVPASAQISCKEIAKTGYFSPEWKRLGLIDPMSVAQAMWQRERGDFAHEAIPPVPKQFLPGGTREMQFSFLLGPGLTVSWTLGDRWREPDSAAVPLSGLPQSFQDEVRNCLDAFRKAAGSGR